MTAAPIHSPSRQFPADGFLRELQLLEELFGVPFELQPSQTQSPLQPAQAPYQALFGDLASLPDAQPRMQTLDGYRRSVTVPLPSLGGGVCAQAIIETSDPRLLSRMLSTVPQLLAPPVEPHDPGAFDEFACQVSRDFDELVWLRRLAERADGSLTQPATDLARELLPELRMLVQAEGMAFIMEGQEAWHEELERPSSLAIERCGDAGVPDADLLEAIFCHSERGRQQPVVVNRWRDATGQPASLHSFILIAVEDASHHYGWLIAFNRLTSEGLSSRQESFTAYSSAEDEFGTIEAGLVQSGAAALASHARKYTLYRELELLLMGLVRTMTNAIEARDAYTRGHSDRVARISRRLAEEMGLDRRECERIYLTGLVHDLGKIGVPDSVLLKPGRLTDEEFDLIKQHPVIGHQMLQHLKPLRYVLPGVLHHHEALDGSGYPDGLKGDEIPLMARIIAVADSLDAMTSSRPYRAGMPLERAEAILDERSGIQWDPEVVAAQRQARDDIVRIISEGERSDDLPRAASHGDSRDAAASQRLSLADFYDHAKV